MKLNSTCSIWLNQNEWNLVIVSSIANLFYDLKHLECFRMRSVCFFFFLSHIFRVAIKTKVSILKLLLLSMQQFIVCVWFCYVEAISMKLSNVKKKTMRVVVEKLLHHFVTPNHMLPNSEKILKMAGMIIRKNVVWHNFWSGKWTTIDCVLYSFHTHLS